MSGWNEDNFLEKMMPLLEKNDSAAGECPNAEILGAVADGMAPDAVRAAVNAHAAHCSNCAGLMARLHEFHFGAEVAENEWRDTERRLDVGMREFLAQPGRPARRAVRSPWWSLSWALVPIAAAAMLILLLPKVTIPRRKTLQSVEARLPAMPALDKPSPGIPSQPAAQEPAQASATTAETPVNPPPQPLETAGNVLPVPATATPEPDTHPESEAEPGPSSAHSMAPGFAPVVATAAGQPSRPEPAAPPPAPAFVRINAGTRVWILLQSTSPAANGGFAFKGMVLLPVTEGGTVLLDRETRVVGTGKVDQGRTTIRIAEFVWQGTRYRLRRAPQAPASRSPGSGPAVEFNAGQVLETWMAVPSIYEKVQGNAPKG